MSKRPYTHVSFSDESNWNTGRYRSIGMVSAERSVALELHSELAKRLDESDVRDFKWLKLKTAKQRFAAEKILDSVAKRLSDQLMRFDILCWDSQDYRHTVAGRDDAANLQRMYFHLFRNVMRLRWPSDCIWKHMPDEQTALDWNGVEYYLRQKSHTYVTELDSVCADLEEDTTFGGVLKRNFNICEIAPCKSHEMALCQAADLLAGIGCYSREHYREYGAWSAHQGYADLLFDDGSNQPSRRQEERHRIIQDLIQMIHRMGFDIDIDRDKGFRTWDPNLPLNFWWYEPKSWQDKAPSSLSPLSWGGR